MIVRVLLASAAILALTACGKSDDADEGTAAESTTTEAAAPTESVALSGEDIFKRCAACHNVEQAGKNGIGPNLHGVTGRPIASMAGFVYSTALKAKGGNWDDANLDSYLTSPAKFAPGTRMVFAGLNKPEERKAVIDYLATLK